MRPLGMPEVVTVVVTYNGASDTLRCLDSLMRTTYPNHSIVVVDNGSSGEAEAIATRFGGVIETISSGTNGGYGAGANLGIRRAMQKGADYVWVLNNDTIVSAETVGRLVAAMEADPKIGLASPQITAPDGPEAPNGIWFAGGTLDLSRGETRHQVDPLAESAGAVVFPFLTGCALMVRLGLLREIGLFWERLFLYWEDTDLDLRAQRYGWKTCVVADAWIRHEIHGGASSAVVDYHHFRNALLVAWRHRGTRTAASASVHLGYAVVRRWASALLRRRPAPQAATAGLLAGVATVARWTVRAPRDARLREAAVDRGRPLAVLHVVRRYSPLLGGTELYVHDLARAQALQGYRVTVVTLDKDVTGVDLGRFPRHEVQEGVRIVRMPGVGSARFAITGHPLTLVREIARADVVHIHDLRFMMGLTCVTARLCRRRVILHTHGLIFHTSWHAGLKRFLVRAYYGPLARITGAVVAASSEPDRQRLVGLAPYLNRGSVVVENAIRLEHLLTLPRRPVEGRVLAFGRVARSKSLDHLVKTMANVSTPGWELWIAGAEEFSRASQARAGGRGVRHCPSCAFSRPVFGRGVRRPSDVGESGRVPEQGRRIRPGGSGGDGGSGARPCQGHTGSPIRTRR